MMLRRNTHPRVILCTVSKPLAAAEIKPMQQISIERCAAAVKCQSLSALQNWNHTIIIFCFWCLVLVSVFLKCIYLFFWLHPVSCGILVPQPGIESASPAVEPRNLHHWTTGEGPTCLFLICVEHLPLDRLKYSVLWSRVYHYRPTAADRDTEAVFNNPPRVKRTVNGSPSSPSRGESNTVKMLKSFNLKQMEKINK